MPDNNNNLFKKLTSLFRSGPVVKRKIKNLEKKGSYSKSSLEVFKKAHSDVYNSTLRAYGSYDRMSRYSDFSEMEGTPEISSALDIYAEECVSPDVEGTILNIYSENKMVKKILDELFYDVLNVDFNLVMWVRNLCKYGDFFLFNDIHPEYGVVNCFPIPISEIEREEGFDSNDPGAVRFRWVTQGNRVLENWQVSHFRLLGSDAFLPYGSSVLEGARRVWRQLILIEDAMLVYRVIRSPERRVFYIDVGNIPPENIADYLEQAQTSLKRNAVVDKNTGQVDLRYNPLSVDEDYFLPVRGGESGTRIETLAGGSNTTAIEDVEYIQKKLFAALKIPKAYLGYDEDIGAKATLAQEDIRFSRTIQRIQKTIISELNKVAMIHLYSHGYTDESLLDFQLKLCNPSSIAQQQKLEIIRTKFEIAAQAPEGFVDREWIRKHIIELNDDEIARIEKGRDKDKIREMELEVLQLPESKNNIFGDEDNEDSEKGLSPMDDIASSSQSSDSEEDSGGLFSGEIKKGKIMSEDDLSEYDDLISEFDSNDIYDTSDVKKPDINPVKPSPKVKKGKFTRNRKSDNPIDFDGNNPFKKDEIGGGALSKKGLESPSYSNLFIDSVMPQSPVIKNFIDKQISHRMSKDLEKMSNSLNINTNKLLKENNDDYDIIIDDNMFENKEIDNGEES